MIVASTWYVNLQGWYFIRHLYNRISHSDKGYKTITVIAAMCFVRFTSIFDEIMQIFTWTYIVLYRTNNVYICIGSIFIPCRPVVLIDIKSWIRCEWGLRKYEMYKVKFFVYKFLSISKIFYFIVLVVS